jgi:4-hydroxybenzoate polyprenyltransferase
LWKANVPHWVWIGAPAWIGAVLLGLDGRTPDWGSLALFIVTVITIQSIAEFANSYTDREEDRLYGPTNTLVTGELDCKVARKVLIFQNILAAFLLIALLVITLNYILIAVMAVGWFFGLAYSVFPLRLKETPYAPFDHALAFALLPIAGWLIVEPSLMAKNGFILAFASFLFLHSYGLGITLKFRKTLLALDSGLVGTRQDSDLYNLTTIGFRLKFKTAMYLEAITALGAFLLVPIFWYLGVFDAALSIALLALPMPLTALAMILRTRDPVKNSSIYKVLMTLSWILIVVTLLGYGLASVVPWVFAALACVVTLAGFPLLVRIVHPWGAKSLNARY